MGEGSGLKIFRIFVVFALVVSLYLNYHLSVKMKELEHTLSNISADYSHILHSVNGQTYHLEEVLREIQEEQSWIGPVEVRVDRQKNDMHNVVANFLWQVKEYPDNAQVTFHYSLDNKDSFLTLTPEEVDTGVFQVVVPIEIDLMPQWEMMYHHVSGNTNSSYESVEIPAKEGRYPAIEYFISMSHDGVVKSSHAVTEDLTHLAVELYGYIITDITVDKDNLFVHVSNDNYGIHEPVENVYLLLYKNNQKVDEVELTNYSHDEEHFEHFRTFSTEGPINRKEYSRIVMKVVYGNGDVFEKEIH